MGVIAKGKKFAGQDRWTYEIKEIVRITDKPSVGKDTMIGGKEVRFDVRMLLDLLRRREYGTENDSLRSRSYDTGGGGSSDDTQTEAAALRGLPPGNEHGEGDPDDWSRHVQADPIGRVIEEALSALSEMGRYARVFEGKLGIVLNADAAVKAAANRGSKCSVCARPVDGTERDILHRGRYCGACNKAWERAGRPHEIAEMHWAEGRREELGAVGKIWGQDSPATFYGVDEIDALQATGALPMQRAV